ncbi:riboflavin synthase, alpha subunit [Selenomonas sp. FOBRC6]|uniref:riboflavin synthase n=1 Tax=Selenomonas sp. FOBRC6 TaxID=936572 RepID=UPI000278289D|nr:riboflavin synthase [Selenomonas sp. FOBRC6]EJO22871.1 riboflavin synthase, alpha subunit [Selenomonas sp. FOBRC6]
MFTGIIEEVGTFAGLSGGNISIGAQLVQSDAHIGDSIAVNGICLTVTSFDTRGFRAAVMPETMRRTSLAGLMRGAPLNLERALLPTMRLGGHFVSGHIDGVGEIRELHEEGNAILMTVAADDEILRGIVEKGSVALDGISLTVAAVGVRDFTVSLIPHTRTVTNLGAKRVGSPLNIETDILGKYALKLLGGGKSAASGCGITQEFLLQNGF